MDRPREGAMASLEVSIDSHPANLAAVRRRVETFAAECGFDSASRDEIGLCVNEALANVIRHAYQGATDRPIVIRAGMDGQQLRIAIRDWGCGIDPSGHEREERDPLVPGGVGLLCLRQLMDEVRYEKQPDGMLLVMWRSRSARAPAAQNAG